MILEKKVNTGANPGFFLGGGALVSWSTLTPINHIVFFFGRIPVVLENRRSSREAGVRTPCTLPLDPPLEHSLLAHFPKVRTDWLEHSWTSHFDNEKCFFPWVFVETRSPSCMLFRIWLIWLDCFDKQWNSHYDWKGLAGQFWQMESAIRLQFVTIETKRSLQRVNFRKGAWEKIGQ